ncbi:MAG: hypothetical protein H0W88_11725 [Parachlamydiaceae bacterium]|nr:hypothetical protein [Parachlamydiaceae bacterium]
MLELNTIVQANVPQNFTQTSISKPSEAVLAHIISFMGPKQLANTIETCSELRIRILNNDKIWHNTAIQMRIPKPIRNLSWRDIVLMEQSWLRNIFTKTVHKIETPGPNFGNEEPLGTFSLYSGTFIESYDSYNKKSIYRGEGKGPLADFFIHYFNGIQGIATKTLTFSISDTTDQTANNFVMTIFNKELKITKTIQIANCPSHYMHKLRLINDTIFFDIAWQTGKIHYFYKIPNNSCSIKLSDLTVIPGFSSSIHDSLVHIYQMNAVQIYNVETQTTVQRNIGVTPNLKSMLLIQNTLIQLTDQRMIGKALNDSGEIVELWNFPKGSYYRLIPPNDDSHIFAMEDSSDYKTFVIFNALTGKELTKIEAEIETDHRGKNLAKIFLKHNSFSYTQKGFNLIVKEFQPYSYPVLKRSESLTLEKEKTAEKTPKLKVGSEKEKSKVNTQKDIAQKKKEIQAEKNKIRAAQAESLIKAKANFEDAQLALEYSLENYQKLKSDKKITVINKTKDSFIYDLAKRTAIYTLLMFSCFVIHRFVSIQLQTTQVQAFIRRFWEKNNVK